MLYRKFIRGHSRDYPNSGNRDRLDHKQHIFVFRLRELLCRSSRKAMSRGNLDQDIINTTMLKIDAKDAQVGSSAVPAGLKKVLGDAIAAIGTCFHDLLAG